MEVLHPTSDLAPPNMCVICKETPDRTKRVIDTGQSFVIPGSDVVGRAYVCEKCGLTIANRLGFVSNEQSKVAFHAAEAAASRLLAVKEKILTAAEDIHAFATDVDLGNERSSVAKWIEGDFTGEITTPSSKPSAEEIGKAVRSSGSPSKKPGAGAKSAKRVESLPANDELPLDDGADSSTPPGI